MAHAAGRRGKGPCEVTEERDATVSVDTDVALWVAVERPTVEALGDDWWDDDRPESPRTKALAAGRLLGVSTGADGKFVLRWTFGPLAEREARVLADESATDIVVESGPLLVGDPSRMDGRRLRAWKGPSLVLAPGCYRVRICSLAWSEDPGSLTRDGARSPRSLPDYVLVLAKVETTERRASAAFPSLVRGPSRARRLEEARIAEERAAARERLRALGATGSEAALEATLAALDDDDLRQTAVELLAQSSAPSVVERLVALLEAEGVPPRSPKRCDALLRALAPHRSAAAEALAERHLLTSPVGAGQVLLRSDDVARIRRVAEALVDPSLDPALVELGVSASFRLEPTEAFDRIQAALASSAVSRNTAALIERAALERIAFEVERVDPRWKRVLYRAFDPRRHDLALVALAMARVDGVDGADTTSMVRQAFAEARPGPALDALRALYERSGKEPLASLARAARST